MRRPPESDEWYNRVEKLRQELESDDTDTRIRAIAREEADGRIKAILSPLVFFGALWLANREYGTTGIVGVLAVAAAWFGWIIIRANFDPSQDRRLITDQAEDMCRLRLLVAAHIAGEKTWFVKEKKFEADTREIHVFDGERWNDFWQGVHRVALEFQDISPRRRRHRLLDAARAARIPLENGGALAEQENAELVFWASNYLHRLKVA